MRRSENGHPYVGKNSLLGAWRFRRVICYFLANLQLIDSCIARSDRDYFVIVITNWRGYIGLSERLRTKWLYLITNTVPKSGRSRFMIQLLAADQEVASLATPPFIADVAAAAAVVVALGVVKLGESGYVEGKPSETADELV